MQCPLTRTRGRGRGTRGRDSGPLDPCLADGDHPERCQPCGGPNAPPAATDVAFIVARAHFPSADLPVEKHRKLPVGNFLYFTPGQGNYIRNRGLKNGWWKETMRSCLRACGPGSVIAG